MAHIPEYELAIECAVLARAQAIELGNGNFDATRYFYKQLCMSWSAARSITVEIHRRGLFSVSPEEARALIVATAQARLGKMLKLQVSATGKPIRDPRKPEGADDPWLYEYDDTAATRWARELAKQTGSDAPVKSEVTIVSVADELKRRIARLERGNADATVVQADAKAIDAGSVPAGVVEGANVDQVSTDGDSSGDARPAWWCEGLE